MAFEDIAQDIELKQWELNNLNRPSGPVRHAPDDPGYGPAECDDCGSIMPEQRRAWGFKVCVDCQTEIERRAY